MEEKWLSEKETKSQRVGILKASFTLQSFTFCLYRM